MTTKNENKNNKNTINSFRVRMLVKIVNCVLNGDPNTGDQRLDDEGHGYVTDVAVARWIKNYFAWKGHELSIDGVKTAKDFKGMSVDDALAKFIDIRLFGCRSMMRSPSSSTSGFSAR